jgi:hypothetical protein
MPDKPHPVNASTPRAGLPEGHPYVLPWPYPVPHRYAESAAVSGFTGLAPVYHGFDEKAQQQLHVQACDLDLVVDNGLPVDVILKDAGPDGAAAPGADEQDALAKHAEGYWVDLTATHCVVRTTSYAGAVHALVRLAQWRRLPAEARPAFRMLDFPRLDFRGMNRDDEEDWSRDYWTTTIRYARNLFQNHLALSAEQAFLARAAGEEERYQDMVARFHAIRDEGSAAGITVLPMFYNIDHMLGQFLKAAGREDLTRMANRVIIRYESSEAWKTVTALCATVLADLAPRAFAMWASESSHEDHGMEGLKADDQWNAEAAFYADLLRRVRERVGDVSLTAILSQGTRERVHTFTRACDGLPVQFVHYDGEWTYCMPCPLALPPTLVRREFGSRGEDITTAEVPPLTMRQVGESLAEGHPWIGKPAWIRIAYLGLPYVRPAAIVRECRELIDRGYHGIFPNASRWQSLPWNVSLGSAAAWGAGRISLDEELRRFFAADLGPHFSLDDIHRLEAIWIRITSLNTPMEAAPRFSAFRALVYQMALFVAQACEAPDFAVSGFEEVYFMHTWQREAGWLRDALEQVGQWKARLAAADPPADPATLWPHSVQALDPLLALHAHMLAAAYVVCRESAPDNCKGPWRAWRRLVQWHLERTCDAIDGILAIKSLDNYVHRHEGSAFDQPAELPTLYKMQEPLHAMQKACRAVLDRIEDPAAFSALHAAPGLDGDWPGGGLYETLNWPVYS